MSKKRKRVNKFNFKNLEQYQIRNVIAILVCLFFVGSLSIGYAVLSQNLKVEGTISLQTEKTIRIIKVADFTPTAGAYEVYNASHNKESITINIELPEITSTASYTITIANNCDVDMELKSIVEDAYTNPLITYDFTNLKTNDTIAKDKTITVTITFRYKDEVTAIPENKSLGANIKFEFIEHVPDEYEFTYQNYYNKYALTKYLGTSTNVTIPTTYKDLDVMSIDKYAFQNKNLTTVTFPERLQTIAFSTFTNNYLSSLVFPATLTSIGNEAFFFNKLEIISFRGETPPTISATAFDYNFKLKTVCIPATANKETWKTTLDKVLSFTQYDLIAGKQGACATIGTGEVEDNTTLDCGTNAYQSGATCVCHEDYEGDPYTSCNLVESLRCLNVTYQSWTKSYIITGYNCSKTDITIPGSYEGIKITKINKDSFKNKNLTSVTIDNNIETIDMYAFKDNKLTTITIPSSVTSIVNFALEANDLKSVVFKGTTPPTIGQYAFRGNQNLTKICVPAGTTAAYQKALSTVTLPEGTEYYEDENMCK